MLSGLSILGVITSLFTFSKMNMHILILLISLEFLMLSILVFLLSSLMVLNSSFHMFLIVLAFAACEAALGLSLLVSILRMRGNDYLISLSLLKY